MRLARAAQTKRLAGPAILSPAFVLFAASLHAQSKPQYEIYAVRYATLANFPVNGLIEGADPSRKLDIAMMVWLIRGNGITDVVISHMHRDHADGLDFFPKAKIWLQKDELEYYAGSAWQSRRTHGGIDPDDVLAAVRLNTQSRVGLVAGDAQEILPGITCYTGGKHTYASQFVSVHTAAGTIVLASDNMYLYENLDKHVPIASSLDKDSNLRAQDRMKQLAAEPRLIIPGHDPAVMTRFKEVAPGVVKIE